jgi:hypothetical protein
VAGIMRNNTRATVTTSWGQGKITAFTIFLILIDGLAVLGNVLVIVVVLLTKELRRREANYFVISLSVADLLVASTIVPITVASLLNPKRFAYYHGYKTFLGFGNFFFCICSIMNLTLLSLDRYFAIAFPYRYLGLMTRKKAGFMCIMTWVYSLAFSLPPFFGISSYSCFTPNFNTCSEDVWRGYDTLIFAVLVLGFTYVLSLTSMSFCYWKIFKVARSHSRQIAALQSFGKTITNNKTILRKKQNNTKKMQKPAESPNDERMEAIEMHTGKAVHSTEQSFNPEKAGEELNVGPPKQSPIALAEVPRTKRHKRFLLKDFKDRNRVENSLENSQIVTTGTNFGDLKSFSEESNEATSSSSFQTDNNFHSAKNEIRVATSFLIIIGLYVLCWTPFCFILATDVLKGVKSTEEGSLICLWIGYINSCINPFIYTWKYRQFRKALIRLLRKVKLY